MRAGDLVRFHTDAWVFKHAMRNYRNPGLILRRLHDDRRCNRAAYEVLWADGRVTNEWTGYLRLVNASG